MKKTIQTLLLLSLTPLLVEAKPFQKIRNFFGGASSKHEQPKRGRYLVSQGTNAMDFKAVAKGIEGLGKHNGTLVLTMPYSPRPESVSVAPKKFKPSSERIQKLARVLSDAKGLRKLTIHGMNDRQTAQFLQFFKHPTVHTLVIGGYNTHPEYPGSYQIKGVPLAQVRNHFPQLQKMEFRGFFHEPEAIYTHVGQGWVWLLDGKATPEGLRARHLFKKPSAKDTERMNAKKVIVIGA